MHWFRQVGRRSDPATGLYYYRARYYSPKLGRFLQTDPIGSADDQNLYAYVKNDPLDATDPMGMWCVLGIGTTCEEDPEPAVLEEVTVTAKREPADTLVAGSTTVAPWYFELKFPSLTRLLPTATSVVVLSGMITQGCGDSGTVGACAKDNVALAEQKPSDKTRRSKPKNAPPGTRPINQTGRSHENIEGVKGHIGAGPADWVGEAPNGDIVTTNPDGTAENHGPYPK